MKILFRAKEKNTDNYIIGYEYYNHIEDEYYITHYITGNNYKVDKSTRSINFDDMLDSNGNKIFASLQEDGKGGDIMLREYENWYGNNYPKKIYIEKEELITYFDDGLKFIEKINKKQSVFGLTTAKKFKVIGIQE